MVCQQHPSIMLTFIIAILVPVSIDHMIGFSELKTTQNAEPILNIDSVVTTINTDILTTELMYLYIAMMVTIIGYKIIFD